MVISNSYVKLPEGNSSSQKIVGFDPSDPSQKNNLSGSARPAAPRTMLWPHRNREHPSSVSPAFLHLPFGGRNRKPTE